MRLPWEFRPNVQLPADPIALKVLNEHSTRPTASPSPSSAGCRWPQQTGGQPAKDSHNSRRPIFKDADAAAIQADINQYASLGLKSLRKRAGEEVRDWYAWSQSRDGVTVKCVTRSDGRQRPGHRLTVTR